LRRIRLTGTYTVIDVRARVAASRRASQKLHSAALEEFDFTTMIPYEPGQLADWPAETYEVSLEAAVVTARTIALPAIRAEVEMERYSFFVFRSSFKGSMMTNTAFLSSRITPRRPVSGTSRWNVSVPPSASARATVAL
jgi:hypothetical protein